MKNRISKGSSAGGSSSSKSVPDNKSPFLSFDAPAPSVSDNKSPFMSFNDPVPKAGKSETPSASSNVKSPFLSFNDPTPAPTAAKPAAPGTQRVRSESESDSKSSSSSDEAPGPKTAASSTNGLGASAAAKGSTSAAAKGAPAAAKSSTPFFSAAKSAQPFIPPGLPAAFAKSKGLPPGFPGAAKASGPPAVPGTAKAASSHKPAVALHTEATHITLRVRFSGLRVKQEEDSSEEENQTVKALGERPIATLSPPRSPDRTPYEFCDDNDQGDNEPPPADILMDGQAVKLDPDIDPDLSKMLRFGVAEPEALILNLESDLSDPDEIDSPISSASSSSDRKKKKKKEKKKAKKDKKKKDKDKKKNKGEGEDPVVDGDKEKGKEKKKDKKDKDKKDGIMKEPKDEKPKAPKKTPEQLAKEAKKKAKLEELARLKAVLEKKKKKEEREEAWRRQQAIERGENPDLFTTNKFGKRELAVESGKMLVMDASQYDPTKKADYDYSKFSEEELKYNNQIEVDESYSKIGRKRKYFTPGAVNAPARDGTDIMGFRK